MASHHPHLQHPTECDGLSALLENPERVSTVPTHMVPMLIADVAARQATLSAVQGLLTSRLLTAAAAPAQHQESSERLLTAEEVAHALGVTKRWVQRRARRLPFSRQLSDRAIRYSEAGLRRWMANRHVRAA
jgi:predicted DNA-binding transcriptional regulator AlpA